MTMNHGETDDAGENELRQKLRDHLKGKDFFFNPDAEAVTDLIRAMVKKRKKTGEFHCPCRMVVGDPEKDKKIICPCDYHESELERDGHCHCRLFVKKRSPGD